MSHLVQADFSAEVIRAEAIFNQALKRINDYNLKGDVKEKLINDFGLNEISKFFESHHGKAVSRSEYEDIVQKSKRVNEFFTFIDNYIVQNFNLEVENYNTVVKDITKLWVNQNKKVLNEALREITDKNLKNYIVSAFKENQSLSKEQLIDKAKELFQKSDKYKEQQIQKNIERLLKQKNIKEDEQIKNKSSSSLEKINERIANNEIDKTVRNKVLSSIIKIIKKQGFIVKKENVVDKGEFAVINAIKPDGKKTRFEVYLDGKFRYKYHQYEGLSCKKDIELFEKEFENIYGVKLENKDVLWSNPDRLQKQAHKTINNSSFAP